MNRHSILEALWALLAGLLLAGSFIALCRPFFALFRHPGMSRPAHWPREAARLRPNQTISKGDSAEGRAI